MDSKAKTSRWDRALGLSRRGVLFFSNLRITPSSPLSIHNGGEVAGMWHVDFASDYGRFQGDMNLHRDVKVITGTWAGAFGKSLSVSGTWRDGYVELTFPGGWQEDAGATPTPAIVTMAGWIDNAMGAGRMKVEGRADGPWSGVRQKN